MQSYNQGNVTSDCNYKDIHRILDQIVGCNDIITAEGPVYVISYLLLQFLYWSDGIFIS